MKKKNLEEENKQLNKKIADLNKKQDKFDEIGGLKKCIKFLESKQRELLDCNSLLLKAGDENIDPTVKKFIHIIQENRLLTKLLELSYPTMCDVEKVSSSFENAKKLYCNLHFEEAKEKILEILRSGFFNNKEYIYFYHSVEWVQKHLEKLKKLSDSIESEETFEKSRQKIKDLLSDSKICSPLLLFNFILNLKYLINKKNLRNPKNFAKILYIT